MMCYSSRQSSWICGATKGIGRAIVGECTRNNGVVFASSRTISPLCSRENDSVTWLSGDLESAEVVLKHASAIGSQTQTLDAIYIAVHRPYAPKPLSEISWRDYANQFEGTIRPAVNVITAAVNARLLSSGSSIVLLSCVTVASGSAELLPRTTAKGALEALTRSLAQAFSNDGIRVNGIAVGWTQTPQLDEFIERGGKIPLEQIPLGRVASVDEIAQSAVFLGSKKSGYLTGTVIPVSGGLDSDIR